MTAGERCLFPTVREASGDTRVVSNGFSCSSQIEQGTSRKTHHLTQVVADAWRRP